MAGEETDPWPRWNEPATKGDLISAIIATRVCIVDIYVCLRALQRNDPEALAQTLDHLSKNDDRLQEMADALGGKKAPKRG